MVEAIEIQSDPKQINEDMLTFEPSNDEIFLKGSKPDQFVRLIYAKKPLYEKEQAAIDGFIQFAKTNNYNIDP